ncbi:MAG: hypothetical protein QF440_04280 [Candidatus Thalassarchaeaceae archaeon]|nr:hypothetical protein [Candidatus Thalassarchaeaceae archaeon]
MWAWIAFLATTSSTLLWMSRDQPFPEISARWGWIILLISGILAIATQSPRATNEYLAPILSAAIGGLGVVIGVRHSSITKRDVLVAPFAGLWLAVGTITLLTKTWPDYNQTEQITGFILATLVVALETFLFWKGLIIGIQGVTWSQAALRQLDRGLIVGDRGSISMFEKSWDVEESWLDAMSHAALYRIHEHQNNPKLAAKHAQLLERLGGEEVVDSAWLETIDKCIKRLKKPILEEE